MAGKGSMCANPFGGRTRLDKLDFLEAAGPSDSAEKLIALTLIKVAVHKYLYFGLGDNKISADDFYSNYRFLFQTRSSDRQSWEHARLMKDTEENDSTGKRETTEQILSDAVLKAMCLDSWYDVADLSKAMSLDRFIAGLKRQRRIILVNDWDQVKAYLDVLRRKNLKQYPVAHPLPAELRGCELDILISPKGLDLARLLYSLPSNIAEDTDVPGAILTGQSGGLSPAALVV